MQPLDQAIREFSSKALEQRKQWYSPAATDYDRVRPRYPDRVVEQVIEIAELSADSRVLEVGCGPATATMAIAPLGCSIVGLEPNPDFFRLAQHHCAPYPNVTLHNTAFEEWPTEPNGFDAVLAASSFHWIPSDIAYAKAATALREQGRLILLWNKELQPTYTVYQHLQEIYQTHAPWLDRYEDRPTRLEIINGLGQPVKTSALFCNVQEGYVECETTYTVEQYLSLLNTYSPFLALDPIVKEALFIDLSAALKQACGETLQLSYISAFHIAQKNSSRV